MPEIAPQPHIVVATMNDNPYVVTTAPRDKVVTSGPVLKSWNEGDLVQQDAVSGAKALGQNVALIPTGSLLDTAVSAYSVMRQGADGALTEILPAGAALGGYGFDFTKNSPATTLIINGEVYTNPHPLLRG